MPSVTIRLSKRRRSERNKRLFRAVFRRQQSEAGLDRRLTSIATLAMCVALIGASRARDFEISGDNSYPNSIMTSEPSAHRPLHARKPMSPQKWHHHFRYAHGSSGVVLPTPLPRTQALPPVGGSMPAVRPNTAITEPAPTILPRGRVVPNLPHGPETFQDRASRCAHQQGLFNIPGSASTQYMTACLQ